MSQTKRLKNILLAIFTFFAFFAFGCDKEEVAVTNINIKLENQSQVVLLVDEFFNLGECVEVYPNYASDKTFSIYSMNENVVRVVGKQIKAISAGETMIRVVSNTDENVEDVISVVVQAEQEKLQIPENLNLRYNETTQTFVFNAIDNAASYTICINEREFNIGNVNAFELSNYVGEKYNNILSVKVKANAPTYGKAFLDSDYSNEIKVYQASSVQDVKIVGGKIIYSTYSDLVYDIYFNNNLFINNTKLNEIDLLNLNADFAGETKKVTVVSKFDETKQINGVDYYSAKSNEIVLNILDEPELTMIGSVISWDAIPFVDGYNVFVAGNFVEEIQDNRFDIKNWSGFENVTNEIEIKVSSKLSNSSKNLAKTQKTNTIKFSRLSVPQIIETANGVVWNSVDNAIAYNVKVKEDGYVKFDGSTNLTTFDLSHFGAGAYIVEIYAIGNNISGNFLSSKVASTTITKHAQVSAKIENYVLKIDSISGEKYKVEFEIDGSNSYSKESTATGDKIEIDLSGYKFEKGLHNISITQLGNVDEKAIDGETKIISFTQLESASVTVTNSIATATRSQINKDAVVSFRVYKKSTPETTELEVQGLICEINTTNTEQKYLSAGEYIVGVYVSGDGSSTFSYRGAMGTGSEAVVCGEKEFRVLSVPSLKVQDYSKAEISIANKDLEATNYSILDATNNQALATITDTYAFDLGSGELKQFKVRANGNGSSTLSSLNSDLISVQRLVTPNLTFDATNNSFTMSANNDNAIYQEANFYFRGLEQDYEWGADFVGLQTGDNNFKLNLVSNGLVGNINYINSLDYEIKVRKLSNTLNASIDNGNRLNLLNEQNANLKLKFNFDNNEYIVENNKIQINGKDLSCVISSNKYIITLLGGDFKAIVPAMVNGFKVQAKFLKSDVITENGIKVYYTDSEWSAESAELNLQKVATATSVYTDTSNRIIVENPNNQVLYINLTFNINGTSNVFKDNGNNQIVNAETVLNYTYSDNKYYIDICENDEIKLAGLNQGENFGVKVQFVKTLVGSDVDSVISAEKTINYLQSPSFVRSEQTLSFTSSYVGYGLEKYNVIINDSIEISMTTLSSILTMSTDGELTKYTVNVTDLWDSFGAGATSVNSLKLEILNSATTETNPLLGSVGNKIYIQRAQTFNVETEKVQGFTNVKVDWFVTEYEKYYSLNILTEDRAPEEENKNTYIQAFIKEKLDDLTFTGNLKIEGFVKANSSYVSDGKTIEVFNSVNSNSITITRLNVPVVSVDENKINYTTVSGATDYEVYILSGGNYLKVDESRLNRQLSSFMFNDLAETAELTVKVRATTSNNSIINSNMSEAVVIKKLAKPSVSVVGGNVRIVMPVGYLELIEAEDVSVKLALNLAGSVFECEIYKDYTTSVAGIVWNENYSAFVVNSNLIFNYTEDYLQAKQINVEAKINGKLNNKNYVYSDVRTSSVYGLFAPIDVKIEKIDESIERISWKNNPKNKLTADGELVNIQQYVFAFNYEGKTYYSTDSGLKYLSEGVYQSYGLIAGTNVSFPYGYDANKDGDFDDVNDVIFDTGYYGVLVAAVADDYVSSPYSAESNFSIMETTTLSINDGKLSWTEVVGATSYIVRIRKQDSSIVKKIEIIPTKPSDYIYNFEDFDLNNDLFYVTVQAITDKEDILNSKESESLAIYRISKATAVEFDDGMLKITASPLAYAIDIEYCGKTYRYINPHQEENLTNVALAGLIHSGGIVGAVKDCEDVIYGIDMALTNASLAGLSGKIKVRICGNTGTIELPTIGNVGIVNSQTVENVTTVGVLKTNVNKVNSGVWTFSQNTELGSTNKTKINYNLNNVATINAFWLDAIVYKISIDTYNQGEVKNDVIYSVDYERFKSAVDANILTQNTTEQTYYELIDDKNDLCARIVYKYGTNLTEVVYINVYKDNTLDLQTYDALFYYPIVYKDFSFAYQTKTGTLTQYETIDLASGGSFVVKILTLGGDGAEGLSYTYLNAPSNEQTFVRFGQSYVSTKSGQLVFADLKVDGSLSPIYKIGVYKVNENDIWNVYLFDSNECSENDVREKFNLTSADICEPIIYLTDSNQIAFEMGKYFTFGAYNTDVRALAGVGADDYLLNAKQPTENDRVIVKVLSSPSPKIANGNIVFDLSYVNNDGVYAYTNEYEVVVALNGVEYSEKISATSSNVLIEGTTLTYTMPNSISGLNIGTDRNYQIKIRAITNVAGMINSPFKDENLDGYNDYLTFTRNTSVSNVTIENGILKWVGDSGSSKYLIKVVDNNNHKTILIDEGYNQAAENCSYTFTETEYDICGLSTKTQILPDINYTISVSKVGNNSNVISSSYTDCANVFRISHVESNEMYTSDGILNWVKIEDAVGYSVELVGSEIYTYNISGNVNSIDLSTVKDAKDRILPAGSYKVRIRVLANEQINSLRKESELSFVKLEQVDKNSVNFDGDLITWDEVSGANGYSVKFSYTSTVTGGAVVDEQKVSSAVVNAPTDVDGKLTLQIVALGDSVSVINSDSVAVTTSNDSPRPINSLTFNENLSRFEWKVDNTNFVDTDILIVTYSFVRYTISGNVVEDIEPIEISYQQNGYYDTVNKVYYLPITIMGEYTNFKVAVHRKDTIDAISLPINRELNWFKYGAGTSLDPYVINGEQGLLNMKYYPTAYYKLINNVDISGTYSSAIQNAEFAGKFDGGNYQINLGDVSLANVERFALFNSLNSAEINNLDIKGNIVNTISKIEQNVYIALLALESKNSILTNVRLINSSIELKEQTNVAQEIVGNLYVSGFFAQDEGSVFSGCRILEENSNDSGLILSINVDLSGYIYFGSISAFANKTTVKDNSNINIQISSTKQSIRYLGGMFGYYIGDVVGRTTGVFDSTISLSLDNIQALYIGGIVGYANYISVNNNTIEGQVYYSNVGTKDIFFGGVAGIATSALLYNNVVEAEISIILQTTNNTIGIGKIVGSLEIDTSSGLSSELKGVYPDDDLVTILNTNTELVLGLSGKVATGVIVDQENVN